MILVLQLTPSATIERMAGLSDRTVFRDREIIMRAIIYDLHNEKDGFGSQIGGKRHHVQVDESKCGTTKYGKGRRVKGVWVLGGVDTFMGENVSSGSKEPQSENS